ncbi:hypothetical protein ABKW10_03450 [Enterobacter asburiae]|uniref:hypothetical protein n=1 Tax=Enterobacter cloacae complex TaxID=354276 RepID=UPI000F87F50B|nr:MULTISPECIES: hypothetical protein [Enterobacter cloacae complex]MBE4895722.1 hypothetical protein [Enterobacter cloacae complex sp. P16RS2]RTP89384.1 hypothetical protein EKN35_15760 [Enterobacter asburiae]
MPTTKKRLALAIILLLQTLFPMKSVVAAELTCTNYVSTKIEPFYQGGEDGYIWLTRYLAPMNDYSYMSATVTLTPTMAKVLEGRVLSKISYSPRPNAATSLSRQVTISATQTTYEFSRTHVKQDFDWYQGIVISKNPKLPEIKTPNEIIDATVFQVINIENGPTHYISGQLQLISEERIADSVKFPDTVDLGKLQIGQNNHEQQIEYTNNTNNIPIRFSNTNTNNSDFIVDGRIPFSRLHTPPFSIGLNIKEGAQPGTYTLNVYPTWTCP